MNTQVINENKTREKQSTSDKQRILYIMDKLADKKIFLKEETKNTPVEIHKLNHGQFKVILPLNAQAKDNLLLYSFLQKYIEIKMKYIKTISLGQHIYEPVRAEIAVSSRKYPRFNILDNSIVINQFHFFDEKENGHLDPYNLPVSIKNVFIEYEKILSYFYKDVKVRSLDTSNQQTDNLIRIINTQKQMLYLHDTQNQNSYFPQDDKLINYGDILGEHLLTKMNEFKHNKIMSIFLFPILYKTHKHKVSVIGYIQICSDYELIDYEGTRSHLYYVYLELLEKIDQARVLRSITTPQTAVDISEGGLKLKISNPHLKNILNLNPELIMNLQFNIANRFFSIDLQGEVVSNYFDNDDKHNVCVAFSDSNDKQLERFRKFLHTWVLKQKQS